MAINSNKSHKHLGIIIDDKLTWNSHIRSLRSKLGLSTTLLARVRRFIDTHTALLIYNTIILPHIDYCCSVWGARSITNTNKFQTLQNKALRIVLKAHPFTSSTTLLTT